MATVSEACETPTRAMRAWITPASLWTRLALACRLGLESSQCFVRWPYRASYRGIPAWTAICAAETPLIMATSW